jgi:mono/diheme cytochrome c family protein
MIYPKTTLAAALAGVAAVATLSQVTSAQDGLSMSSRKAAARGAQAWAANCASCHNFRSLLEKSDAQWEVASTHMRVRANLPGDVVRDIIFFLQSSNEILSPDGGHEHDEMDGEGQGHGEMGAQDAAGHEGMGAQEPAGHEHGEMGDESSGRRIPGNAKRGFIVYHETCVACHGRNGRGAIENVPDLAERLYQPDDHLMISMVEGIHTRGSSIPMPPKGGSPGLTRADLADALAYIRQHFSRPEAEQKEHAHR